jgi:glycerophosphoryl diester phosphodiesterase
MAMMTDTTSGPLRRPLVIAHRGASAEAPENTIAAFELAIAHGADGIELTVHLSMDDQPVVIHDFTLERTTDGVGRVRDQTVRELKRLDAGGWRGARFQGQRIQTLQEMFERFRERTRFWIEVSGGFDRGRDLEERVVSTIEIYDVIERALVLSSNQEALDRIRVLNPEIRLGLRLADPRGEGPTPSRTTIQAVCADARLVTDEALRAIRRAGLDCYVWTVNKPAQMDRLVGLGVSGIITDRPDELRARLDPSSSGGSPF